MCRAVEAVRVLAAMVTFSPSLWAAPAAEPARSEEAPRDDSWPPAKYGVGLRVGGSGMVGGLTALMAGFDLSYSPFPWSAFGLEAELASVDNGADPGFCTGCMRRGSSWRAFGEMRPFDGYYVFPFARVSAGLYDMDIIGKGPWVGPAFGAAAGVEGRLGSVYLRVIAFATAQLGTETPVRRSNHLAGVALEIGAVF